MSDRPIVCTLTPEAVQARREGPLSELARRCTTRQELADGLRLHFSASGDTLSLIAQAVEAERQCCRFLRFAIVVEPDGGPIALELSGPTGTRAFLSGLIEA
jgi:hypothetical protein